jgi:hypothetical protein
LSSGLARIRGSETARSIVGAAISTVIGSIPPAMEAEIFTIQYANLTSGTMEVQLFTRRAGTVTGVIDVAVLSPSNPTVSKGYGTGIIGKIFSENELIGTATSGSVDVTVFYRIVPGRARIP